MVANPEDRFSRDEAKSLKIYSLKIEGYGFSVRVN